MKTKIRELNNEIIKIKEVHTMELDKINHFYWPVVAMLKKKKKYSKWTLTFNSCFLFFVILWLFLQEIVNEYWIAGSLTIAIGTLCGSIFWYAFVLKKIKTTNNYWNSSLKRVSEIATKLNEKNQEAIKLMIEEINDQNAIDEIGSSYDEILEYYNHKTDKEEQLW